MTQPPNSEGELPERMRTLIDSINRYATIRQSITLSKLSKSNNAVPSDTLKIKIVDTGIPILIEILRLLSLELASLSVDISIIDTNQQQQAAKTLVETIAPEEIP